MKIVKKTFCRRSISTKIDRIYGLLICKMVRALYYKDAYNCKYLRKDFFGHVNLDLVFKSTTEIGLSISLCVVESMYLETGI